MDNLWFQNITITQIEYINVQQILVVTFEFTGAACSFMIMSCAARGVKKVGQHYSTHCFSYLANYFQLCFMLGASLLQTL